METAFTAEEASGGHREQGRGHVLAEAWCSMVDAYFRALPGSPAAAPAAAATASRASAATLIPGAHRPRHIPYAAHAQLGLLDLDLYPGPSFSSRPTRPLHSHYNNHDNNDVRRATRSGAPSRHPTYSLQLWSPAL